jgi:hypothetical protein
VLVVTTSVRMVHGVHSDTLHLGEDLLEPGVLVEQQTGLQDRLLITTSTSDDADCGSAAAQDGLTGARWKSDSGLEAVVGVADDGGIGA